MQDEYTEIADAARRALSGAFSLEDLKAGAAVPDALVLRLWEIATAAGWTGLMVPEDAGGVGLGMGAAVVLAEVLGEVLAPGPWAETLALAPCLPLSADLLGALAAGEMRVALAHAVEGEALVDHARTATHFLVIGFGDFDGAAPVLIPAAETQILSDHQPLDPGTPVATVRLAVPRAETVAVDARAFDALRLFTAAQLVGVARGGLSRSIDYAKTRTQFGAAIGSFQAIKHRLADVAMSVDSAALAVGFAAQSWDDGAASATLDILAAYELAAVAATAATAAALQIHGAIGVSWEHDLHLFLKRSHALQAPWRAMGSRDHLVELLLAAH